MKNPLTILRTTVIVILLTLISVPALYACQATQEDEAPRASDSNALYVCVGSNIIINGREISARSISTGYEYAMGKFFINRMTGEIIIYYNASSESMGISTGMYWIEPSIEVDGEIVTMWFETTTK